jgi:hypothetical protein
VTPVGTSEYALVPGTIQAKEHDGFDQERDAALEREAVRGGGAALLRLSASVDVLVTSPSEIDTESDQLRAMRGTAPPVLAESHSAHPVTPSGPFGRKAPPRFWSRP